MSRVCARSLVRAGVVALRGARATMAKTNAGGIFKGKAHVVTVTSAAAREFYFHAESEEGTRAWFEAIQAVITAAAADPTLGARRISMANGLGSGGGGSDDEDGGGGGSGGARGAAVAASGGTGADGEAGAGALATENAALRARLVAVQAAGGGSGGAPASAATVEALTAELSSVRASLLLSEAARAGGAPAEERARLRAALAEATAELEEARATIMVRALRGRCAGAGVRTKVDYGARRTTRMRRRRRPRRTPRALWA